MNESAARRTGGMKNLLETVMHGVFLVCALASILAVALICVFLFANGLPAIREIGVLDFLTGTTWKPGNDIYGILPMIVGSIYITAGAIIIGVPIGLLTAIFMAFYCPKRIYGLLKPCTELLAGIPSIVYGFFGMVVIVPAVRNVAALFGADISGSSILAASILLGIMILPTIIGVSEAALYRHFPSKTKMYEEIIGFAENYVMTAVNSISSSEYSGLEQAKKLFLALIDIKTKEPGLVFLFCGDSLTSEDPRLQGELNRFYGQLQAVFKQSLRLAVAQEEVPEGYDVLTRANMLVALILGHWLRFAKGDASGGAVDPEKQVYLVLGK